MNEPKNDPKNNFWFSLFMWALAVFAVILILGSLLMPPLIGIGPQRAPFKATITQISAFGAALDLFKRDTGQYPPGPNGLIDLVKQPAGTTNWLQRLEKVPLDPWGHPYRYEYPGKHATNSYDLSSAGPDGKFGTNDDISNWKYPQK